MSRVRGWCPSAHRPMLSGDGLLVRVRPRMARLAAYEAVRLADLAERFGNGLIDLTSRGNLQIRGVSEAGHPALLEALVRAGLVAGEPARELPLTVTPFPGDDGLTEALVAELEARAGDLPELPDKMGIVVDTGVARFLSDVSGDFRFERGEGGMILRADGAAAGMPVSVAGAADALVDLAEWFVRTGGWESGRMHRHLSRVAMPEHWTVMAPGPVRPAPLPDPTHGHISLVFGQVSSDDLKTIIAISGASHLVVTPWRSFVLTDAGGRVIDISVGSADISVPEGARSSRVSGELQALESVITDISDPLHRAVACPGAPRCAQAEVETRALARQLAPLAEGGLHVSGCDKGCASRKAFPAVLIGRAGGFDVVLNGTVEDAPLHRGLSEADLLRLFRDAGLSRGAGQTSSRQE